MNRKHFLAILRVIGALALNLSAWVGQLVAFDPNTHVLAQTPSPVAFDVRRFPYTETGLSGVALGDMNQDGYTDIVFGASPSSGKPSDRYIYLLDQRGNVSQTIKFGSSMARTSYIDVGNFNSDRWPDLIEKRSSPTSSSAYEIAIHYFNPQTGKYDEKQISSQARSDSMVIGNLNNDNLLDFVTNGFIYLQDASGNFTASQYTAHRPASSSEASSFYVFDVALADMNNDGIVDIIDSDIVVTFTNNTVPKHNNIYFRDKQGNVTPPTTFSKELGQTRFAVADLNGDDYLDIAACQTWPEIEGDPTSVKAGVSVFFNIPDTISPEPNARKMGSMNTVLNENTCGQLTVADVDGNRTNDLLFLYTFGHNNPTEITRNVALNDGNGNFTLSSGFGLVAGSYGDLKVADLNGDGFIDVLVPQTDVTYVAYNNGANVFEQRQLVDSGNTTTSRLRKAFGDFNGDGLPDFVGQSPFYFSEVKLNRETPNSVSYPRNYQRDPPAVSDPPLPSATNFQTYINLNGGSFTLLPGSLASSPLTEDNDNLAIQAVGDLDGKNQSDFVAVYYGSTGLLTFQNNGSGVFTQSQTITSSISLWARQVKISDVDLDGDQDIVQPGYVQLNDGSGQFPISRTFSIFTSLVDRDVAVADMDADGYPDIVVGGSPSYLYLNDGQGNFTSAGTIDESLSNIVLQDFDGNGLIDIAAKSGFNVVVYLNRGNLQFINANRITLFSATDSLNAADVNMDGAIDLIVGADYAQQGRIFFNDGLGNFNRSTTFGSVLTNILDKVDVTVGDFNNDGAIDAFESRTKITSADTFANSNEFYAHWNSQTGYNSLLANGKKGKLPNNTHRITLSNPPQASAVITSTTLPISYTLFDEEGDDISLVRAYFSLNGGGQWFAAIPSQTTQIRNLSSSRSGTSHVFEWDILKSGVFGQSDNVVFRIEAYTGISNRPNSVPNALQRAYVAAQTTPFRVRGVQLQVKHDDGNAATHAVIYRLQSGDLRAKIIGNGIRPFFTDLRGFLQGPGTLESNDSLVALSPISATSHYTLYHTSATPVLTGLLAAPALVNGLQTLTVSPQKPLVVLSLTVSLEWDARYDAQFLTRLKSDFERVGDLLYDWTDGQATLGNITIYHDKEKWNDADIRIYATNRLRPNANQGGIVTKSVSETVTLGDKTKTVEYQPGQLRIGAVWNRYGQSAGNLGEDWPRTLAHELGHYALFLEDNYLGLDKEGRLIDVDGCPGAMSDPYRDDYTEFHPPAAWPEQCAATLSQQELGRSDWDTIRAHYPWLNAPIAFNANAGPTHLPLALTQVRFITDTLTNPSPALAVPIFYLKRPDSSPYNDATGSAQAFLFRGDRITDLGTANNDQVLARGAQPGDRLCFYDLAAGVQGCTSVGSGEQISLTRTITWQPDVAVTPITSQTVVISVTNVPTNVALQARIYPDYVTTGTLTIINVPLIANMNGLSATVQVTGDTALLAGYVQVSTLGQVPPLDMVTNFAVGGNPGTQRASLAPRGSPGTQRASLSPVLSSDGQAILFTPYDKPLPEGAFYNIQTVSLVPTPPLWATVVGQGYRLTASPTAPKLDRSSLNIGYLDKSVPPGEEDGIQMYYLPDGVSTWVPLTTTLNTRTNEATALVRGPGRYALMSSLNVSLNGAGWNSFGYTSPLTRPVSDALASIAGQYAVIYGYVISDTIDPWKLFSLAVPAYVNDLQTLSYGNGYWIDMAQPTTLLLKGGSPSGNSAQRAEATLPSPPATYYGDVFSWPDGPPQVGQVLIARVGNVECGRGTTSLFNGGIVYTIDVFSDAARPGCGASGRIVSLYTSSGKHAQSFVWQGSGIFQYGITGATAITLLRFTARPTLTGVQLDWATGSEVNTFGFALYRSSTGRREDAVKVTDELIQAKGGVQETRYTFEDRTAIPGTVYTYWLQETETNGRLLEYGPIMTRGPILVIDRHYFPFIASR